MARRSVARASVLAFLSMVALGAAGCAGDRAREVASALSQTLANQRVPSSVIAALCGEKPPPTCASRTKDIWPDVRAFYSKRTGRPIWVNHEAPTRQATDALAALARAAEHGLDPERYGAAPLGAAQTQLADAPGPGAAAADMARFEADVTAALIALGHDVAVGSSGAPPAGVPSGSRRTAPDIVSRLAAAIDEESLATWPDAMRPVHPEYAALQRVLAAGPQPPDRARAIALNMERWRWLPDDLGARHILINIPEYRMRLRENGRPVLDSRVIVGKLGDETPVFSARMVSVIFSPYWNIPESIAEGETVPAIVRDPAYLAKHRIEVLRRTGGDVERIDPSKVDWNNPSETAQLSLRQRPGPGNALGHVKFLLPNRYSVYLHDTPADELFARAGRAFSHGCIRLEDPVGLAKAVLAGDPEWTDEAIRTSMHAGIERDVKLEQPIPVHIVYFTVTVDAAGGPVFLEDVYGRDR